MFGLFKKKTSKEPIVENNIQEIEYYNDKTMHNINYKEEDFDAEVQKRYHEAVADASNIPAEMKYELLLDINCDLFKEWNSPNENRFYKFRELVENKLNNIRSIKELKNAENEDEMLQPIHGVSLKLYTHFNLVEAKGIDEAVMLKALNIEKPIWDEVNSLWINRISNDKKREVLNLWMNYQNEEIDHPVLLSLLNIKPTSDYGEKLCEDYFFYNELNAIMAASEKCGMDTMHFIKEKFGLTQYDLQKSSIEWGSRDFEITSKMKFEGFNYYEQKYKEWYEVFSKDLGGNIADEVTF